MARMASTRLAVDIGGTFTDIVLESPAGAHTFKILTTPEAPELAVMAGIDKVLQDAGVAPVAVELLIHGTTLATNALIERKGAKTAFVTTDGFRDILETGYERRFEQYDVFMDKPPPLVPRPLRFTVPERLSARGRELLPLDEAAVRGIGRQIRGAKAGAVAIGLLHAYVDGRHERRVAELLAAELDPATTICLSSEVCPEMREYERFSTTCANAYVRPMMSGYLARLREMLDHKGLGCPLFLMMSGGGLTTLESARRFPIRLVESGPAGGAILGGHIARECGLDHVLAYDMGGTTAKICLIDHGEPERARKFEVARMYRDLKGSGLPVRVPVIELVEIGAGGGSIARVDALSRITVGPDSAGADPGPACYGRGGRKPTVTDANLALGRIDPARFAGGTIPLQPAAAAEALQAEVGDPLGLKEFWPAAGVSEIVEENMANAARVHAIERGRVISRYTMIAFGGAAPLHAGRLAEKLGIRRILVPKSAGVGSAIGFLRAPVSYEVVRSRRMRLGDFDLAAANDLLRLMHAEAEGVVRPAATGRDLRESRIVDARYVGQGHELQVTLPPGPLAAGVAADLRRSFEAQYRQVYGLTMSNADIEIVTWSVTLATAAAPVTPVAAVERRKAANGETRPIYEPASGGVRDFALHWRFDLAPGDSVQGPAVIAEDETSTIVPASFTAHVNGAGYLVLEAREAADV